MIQNLRHLAAHSYATVARMRLALSPSGSYVLAIQAKVLSLKISCGPHGVRLSIIYKTAVNRCVGDTVHYLVAMATQTGKQIYVTLTTTIYFRAF